jgi:hypothetical protein
MNSLPIRRDCWDLAPNSISPFQSHTNLRLRVESFMHDSKKCYLLTGLGDDLQWIIILEDPTAVLECLRQADNSITALAGFLFLNSMSFATCLPRTCFPPNPNHPSQPLITLGWRASSQQLGASEYTYYEALRDRFLNSPRGCAALLQGGIVWRLAIETLGDGAAEQRVLAGPSGEGLEYASKWYIEGREWCDDALTEAEMNLICGVYQVATGEFNGLQVSCATNPSFRLWVSDIGYLVVAQIQHI